MKILSKMMKNEDGATAIEYGLIAALIAVALITILGQLGGTLSNTFTKIDSKLKVTNSSIT
jgi:pilus assembly protein Flp/PilA